MVQHTDFKALDEEARHCLLSRQLRQETIEWLEQHDGSIALESLASSLAADDAVDSAVDPTRTQVELHHVHLPKLHEHGLVEYDHRSRTVDP